MIFYPFVPEIREQNMEIFKEVKVIKRVNIMKRMVKVREMEEGIRKIR